MTIPKTTPTIEQLHKHYSVRSYKDKPVPRELVERIVLAGQRASTSSNLQTYSVVAVTDPEKRHALSMLCGNQDSIRQAPIFMAWCADLTKLDRACELRGYEHVHSHVENFLVSAVDVALVMQNAAVAAESLGLGMCYIGGIRNESQAVIDLLELPELVFPVSGMTLGWPDSEPNIRPRIATDAILHWEQYDNSQLDEALYAYDKAMIETGIYDGRQVPIPGQEDEVEDYGWIEHSARRVTAPKRVHLLQVLKDQGFGME